MGSQKNRENKDKKLEALKQYRDNNPVQELQKEIIMIYEKKCSKCKEIKSTDKFSHCKSEKDGYSHYCKECDKDKSLKCRENNKETIAEK